MANIINKASNNQVLTPMERALLKLGKNLVIGAFTSAAVVVTAAISAGSPINGTLLTASVTAAIVAVITALSKYMNAQGDTGVSTALDLVANNQKDAYNNIALAGKPTIEKATSQQITLDPKTLDEAYKQLALRMQGDIMNMPLPKTPAPATVTAPTEPVTTLVSPSVNAAPMASVAHVSEAGTPEPVQG